MTISWHGHYTVKITTPATTLVIDPHGKSNSFPPFRGKANVVALSNPSETAMSYLDGLQGNPIILTTPGEYSLAGFSLRAIGWHDKSGQEKSLHRWIIDNLTVVHLGSLTRKLTDQELQQLEQTTIDILLLPLNTSDSFPLKESMSLVTLIEPRIVVPINYDSAKEFAQEMGVNPRQAEPRLTVSRSKLPEEGTKTVILSA